MTNNIIISYKVNIILKLKKILWICFYIIKYSHFNKVIYKCIWIISCELGTLSFFYFKKLQKLNKNSRIFNFYIKFENMSVLYKLLLTIKKLMN